MVAFGPTRAAATPVKARPWWKLPNVGWVEEMGMRCQLEPKFSFVYRADLDHGMTEHELDHVLIGYSDVAPVPNPEEVAAYKYISPKELAADIALNPSNYTAWFKICFPEVLTTLQPTL